MNPNTQHLIRNYPGLYALLALVVIVFFVALYLNKKKEVPPGLKFIQKPIMTANELEFFGRLRAALPDFEIFPQVAMSAVLKPLRTGDGGNQAERNKIDRKVIDFVICSRAFELVCVVELDDRTHNAAHDSARDVLMAGANIKTLRVKSTAKPTAENLRQAVLELTKSAGDGTKLREV
jgi:hypothetical protein